RSVLVGRGDVLLMRPLLAHCSNRSQPGTRRHRRILHLEFAAAAELPDGYAWHDSRRRRAARVVRDAGRPAEAGWDRMTVGGAKRPTPVPESSPRRSAMTRPTRSLEHHAEAIQAERHWQERPRPDAGCPPALTVALTREAGTPGTSVARAVAA